jgi:hypothetical protein
MREKGTGGSQAGGNRPKLVAAGSFYLIAWQRAARTPVMSLMSKSGRSLTVINHTSTGSEVVKLLASLCRAPAQIRTRPGRWLLQP